MNAGRPLRLGVAGLGRAFTLMLPTLQRDARVRLVAACDPREPARERFASDFDAPVYPDIEGLASNPDVEAIYIASPHQFHAEQARIAARHGKHVLVEKPMALSLGDCNAMIRDCRDAGVHLIVGHCHSFDTPYLRAREIALGGEFGRVRMIHALNYTDFLYRPRRPEELRTEEGGGVVFSQAAHQVDIVRLLAGTRVSRVRAITGDWDPRRPTQGAYSALLWFEGGAFASVSYNGYGHFDSDEWCGWIGEMGAEKSPEAYGAARRKLARGRHETFMRTGIPAQRNRAAFVECGRKRVPLFLISEEGPVVDEIGDLRSCLEHGDPLPGCFTFQCFRSTGTTDNKQREENGCDDFHMPPGKSLRPRGG